MINLDTGHISLMGLLSLDQIMYFEGLPVSPSLKSKWNNSVVLFTLKITCGETLSEDSLELNFPVTRNTSLDPGEQRPFLISNVAGSFLGLRTW